MIYRSAVSLCFLLLSIAFNAQSNSNIDKETLSHLLSQYIDAEHPGFALGIVQNGEILFEEYYGFANLEHKIRINEKTRFNIASTAKQFTAIMILELALANKLSIEDDIRKFIPSLFPRVKEEIKIKHLLNHSSGIRDYLFILEMKNQAAWKQIGLDNDDVIELLKKQEDVVFEPGSDYLYSNSGYTILAEIIENVSGKKFNDYSKSFFQKLGMNQSEFVSKYMGIIPNRADPYSDWGDGVWLQTPMLTKCNGDGFLFTTLSDQLHFEQLLHLSEANKDDYFAKSQDPIPNSKITKYGYGLEIGNRLGRPARYHSGSTFGYHSHVSRFPEDKLTVFVMSNNGNLWSGDIADEVSRLILSERTIESSYDRKLFESIENEDNFEIIGQYYSPDDELIRIEEKEGKLFWAYASYTQELLPERKNVFSLGRNSDIKIRSFKDGLHLFYPSGKKSEYYRTSYLPATLSDIQGFAGEYYSTELEMSFEITQDENDQLSLSFSNRDRKRKIKILNRNELLASNFILKVKRDAFDRPLDILVTLKERARNNRFRKRSSLNYQSKIANARGSIQVNTIESINGNASDILLTQNDSLGNEIWSERFGGNSYDKAFSILSSDDGYLITGATSSYGNGNYDMFVIKTDRQGKKQWQKTYGDFYNEYAYIAEENEKGFLIKGSKQECSSNTDVFNRECTTRVWFVQIDRKGRELSQEIRERID
ncbi:MAG: serine hydrolase domain-containing protein [Bacteroidota bacterium]